MNLNSGNLTDGAPLRVTITSLRIGTVLDRSSGHDRKATTNRADALGGVSSYGVDELWTGWNALQRHTAATTNDCKNTNGTGSELKLLQVKEPGCLPRRHTERGRL